MGKDKNTPPIASWEVGVRNLTNLYNKTRAWEQEEAKYYYSGLQQRLESCADFDVPMTKVAALFAVLSPNNDEDGNYRDVSNALAAFQANDWHNFKPSTYLSNKLQALRILQGEPVESVIRGPKTWNFYNNILNPQDPQYVTIDGHMVNAWNNKRVRLTSAGITKREYELIASGVRHLAETLSLVPSELQAVLWLAWKRIHWIKYKPQLKLF